MFWRLEIELKCGQDWLLWEALENLLQASLPVAEASQQMLVLSLYGQFLAAFLSKIFLLDTFIQPRAHFNTG